MSEPQKTKKFLVEYEHNGKTWGCAIQAVDWEDAELHLLSMQESAHVKGPHHKDIQWGMQ